MTRTRSLISRQDALLQCRRHLNRTRWRVQTIFARPVPFCWLCQMETIDEPHRADAQALSAVADLTTVLVVRRDEWGRNGFSPPGGRRQAELMALTRRLGAVAGLCNDERDAVYGNLLEVAALALEFAGREKPYGYGLLNAVPDERERQDERWGPRRDLPRGEWHMIVSEELGEASEELETPTPDLAALSAELVQVAASALCWAQAEQDGRAQKRLVGPSALNGRQGDPS